MCIALLLILGSVNAAFDPAGRLFLTDDAFKELFFQHMILDKLDPALQGKPLATKLLADGSPNSDFNIYLDSLKADRDSTSFEIINNMIKFSTSNFYVGVHFVGTLKMGNPSAPSNVLNLDIHPYTETGKVNITIELQYDEK